MVKKYRNLKGLILPNKKTNMLCLLVFILGIVLGAIFSVIISMNDRIIVIDKIKLFIDNINNGNIDSLIAFKNSMSINLLYVIVIWFLGLALLGVIFNLFMLFIKGFIVSFGIASFILTYHYKGIILSFLYLVFGQLLNIFVILVLTIYSIMFSCHLLSLIFKNNNSGVVRHFLKNYAIILVLAIAISIISATSEAFLLPAMAKLFIKLYI